MTIQTLTRTEDGQGGFTEEWADEGTLSASIEPLNGFQKYQAMQMQTPLTHKIVTRYRTDLTTNNRLKFGDRILWVREVLNEKEANRYLIIKAHERSQP